MRIPFSDLRQVKKIKTYIFGVYAIEIKVCGADPIRFDFFTMSKRDRALQCIKESIETAHKDIPTSPIIADEITSSPPASIMESPPEKSRRLTGSSADGDYGMLSDSNSSGRGAGVSGAGSGENHISGKFRAPITVQENVKLPRSVNIAGPHVPTPLRIYCMAIGSRGDVSFFPLSLV